MHFSRRLAVILTVASRSGYTEQPELPLELQSFGKE